MKAYTYDDLARLDGCAEVLRWAKAAGLAPGTGKAMTIAEGLRAGSDLDHALRLLAREDKGKLVTFAADCAERTAAWAAETAAWAAETAGAAETAWAAEAAAWAAEATAWAAADVAAAAAWAARAARAAEAAERDWQRQHLIKILEE